MVKKVNVLASIFYRKAQMLPVGGSTTPREVAFSIGEAANSALGQIDKYLLAPYEHSTFKTVMEMLASKEMPDQSSLHKAVQEYNAGIKHFSNMANIPVEKLLYVI